jgi:DNA-binding MarR family transcriptional regulator
MKYGKELGCLIRIVTVLRDEIDSEIPIQMAHAFLCVAHRPGMTLQDLGKELGVSQSSTSRNAQTLGAWHRTGKPGYGVIETVDDPRDTRRKIMFLTPKGRDVIGKVIGALQGTPKVNFPAPEAGAYLEDIFKARMRT